MGLPRIFSTTAARLSAAYLLLFACIAGVVIFYVTYLSEQLLVEQTRSHIIEEIGNLSSVYNNGGIPVLVRSVAYRSREPGANLYLIADPTGRILSGNVASLEPGVIAHTGWTNKAFYYKRYSEEVIVGQNSTAQNLREESLEPHYAIAQIIRLSNGLIMLVGRDLGEIERFREIVRPAILWALGVMLFGGFLAWYFVGQRALKRIDAMSSVSKRIMGGDLTGRLPVSKASDEFDRLSGNLNLMLDRIGELNVSLSNVADNIAHDLKTPLTRLRNRAEAALHQGHKDENHYRGALEQAISESDNLIKIFNAILKISRLEAGNAADSMSTIDLKAIALEVFELYEPLAEDANVELKVAKLQEITIEGNRELIGQALSNIVDNAIKYCTNAELPAIVTISLEKMPNAEVVLCVSDNGAGINEADFEQVTQRFVRLEKSRNQPGSGLGLSLVKAVATFHKGQLQLSNANPGLCVAMKFNKIG